MKIFYFCLISWLSISSILGQTNYLDTTWIAPRNIFVNDSGQVFTISITEGVYHYTPTTNQWRIIPPSSLTSIGLSPTSFSQKPISLVKRLKVREEGSFISNPFYDLDTRSIAYGSPQADADSSAVGWCFSTCIYNKRHWWRLGQNSTLSYSDNNGKKWKIISPPKEKLHFNTLVMQDSLNGVLAASMNHLYRTTDNWKSFTRIPTPHQQQKYINATYEDLDVINDFFYWKDYFIIVQSGLKFYSHRDSINWQPFDQKYTTLAQDPVSKEIFAAKKLENGISFHQMIGINNFSLLNKIDSLTSISAMTAHHNQIYCLMDNYQLYIVNKDTVKTTLPPVLRYPPVPNPPALSSYPFMTNHQYTSTDSSSTQWKRSTMTNRVIYQSTAIDTLDWYPIELWATPIVSLDNYQDTLIIFDGIGTYWFDPKNEKSMPFEYDNLFDSFSFDSIQYLSIHITKNYTPLTHCSGCDYSYDNQIRYNYYIKDSLIENPILYSLDTVDTSITTIFLRDNIHKLNSQSYRLAIKVPPLIITSKDKSVYHEFIATQYHPNTPTQSLSQRSSFYYQVFNSLDTISTYILKKIAFTEGYYTTNLKIALTLKSKQKDPIYIRTPIDYYQSIFFKHYQTEGDPWIISYQGKKAVTCNPKITQFILKLLPKKYCIDNSLPSSQQLLKRLANYLYRP